jgi:hypothetical protein
MRPLIWLRVPGKRWRIDWRRMRSAPNKQVLVDVGTSDRQAAEAAQGRADEALLDV